MEDDSSYISKGPCPNPACGSSDACVTYTDGHTHCFSCGRHTGPDGEAKETSPRASLGFTPLTGDYVSLSKRKISEETCRKFNYFVADHHEHGQVQVANYYDKTKRLVAQHYRTNPKGFRWKGDSKKAGLFGQHCWPSGGKRVVVTEGEIDAMSLSQAMGNSWPVVSVPNGADGAKKSLARELEWLESFDEVVLCFDMDEPGRKATAECAELFSPGKCKIVSLPGGFKDANEMWVKGRTEDMLKAVRFNAQTYRPDGIICGDDPKIHDYVINFQPHADADYPWENLNKRIHGIRRGELVTHTAGTGVGKSTLCREIAYALGVTQGQKVGIVSLEESVGRYGLMLTSIAANRRLHLTDADLSPEERERFYRESIGNGNFFLYDHWGSLAAANLLSRLRFLVKGCGCQWIILDHLSIVVSGIDGDDERKTIDKLMTDLRSLCEETGVGLHVISHLSRRQDGKSHEEGAQISLRDLRGSHAIVQLSDIVLGYERNQQDEKHSNRIVVRRLKDRYTGETGKTGLLEYDRDTGRVVEVDEDAEVFDKEEPSGGASEQDF